MANNKNKKGLGRGIDAIFSNFEDQEPQTDSVSEVQLDQIRPNPYQPRRTFNEDALNDLANSIKESGVFQPIIVRESVNGYEIIAGERRYRASKMAGKDTIPAIVRTFDDEAMMEVAVLENLQREDLSPIEEARAYDTLIKKLNITQAEVSKRLGKSRPYIANYLRLLSLPESVKRLVDAGDLSMAQARSLLSLKRKSQIVPMARKTVSEGLTVRQLEKLIARANANGQELTKGSRKSAKSPYVRASENQLGDRFGTKVNIEQTKKGTGKIEIDFESEADLNRVLALLDVNLD